MHLHITLYTNTVSKWKAVGQTLLSSDPTDSEIVKHAMPMPVDWGLAHLRVIKEALHRDKPTQNSIHFLINKGDKRAKVSSMYLLSCPPSRSTATLKQWWRSAVHRSLGNLERTYCRTFPRQPGVLAPLAAESWALVVEVVLLSDDRSSDETRGLVWLPAPPSMSLSSSLPSRLCFPRKSMQSDASCCRTPQLFFTNTKNCVTLLHNRNGWRRWSYTMLLQAASSGAASSI